MKFNLTVLNNYKQKGLDYDQYETKAGIVGISKAADKKHCKKTNV